MEKFMPENEKYPLVSVVMAVYNNVDEKVLESAITSVMQQDYENLELLICDDGSSNNTLQQINRIKKQYTKIRVFHYEQNHGAAYVRNLCIKKAKGQYIAIMDADDISVKNRFTKQVTYLQQHRDIGFVGSRAQFFEKRIGDDDEIYRYCQKPEGKDFLLNLPFVHASCMFRREVLGMVKGYSVRNNRIRVEDYDMLLRIYESGYRGANLPDVLYYIRRDLAQYKRRKYRYRFYEAQMKFEAFRKLGLMPEGIIYALKPLVIGLVPPRILDSLRQIYYNRKSKA